MTAAITAVKVGDFINGVQILSLDPLGKRCAVLCPCGATHLVGVEALAAGAVACPAARPGGKWRS
jgi:hypothetical protein